MKYTYTKAPVADNMVNDSLVKSMNPILVQALIKRGINTPEKVRQTLFSTIQDVVEDTGIKDMDKALDILTAAIENGDEIVVYRDYDCDGITAGAICLESLAYLGAKASQYANDRNVDGYGLCVNGIRNIIESRPNTKIILTVDNGIMAHEGIAFAREQGLTIIVTDHHEQGSTLPPAHAIIDPKRHDDNYHFSELCGAGVAFKVMVALCKRMNKSLDPIMDTLDLVSLATVGDVVPLISENRVLVKEGLIRISSRKRPFFAALASIFQTNSITAQSSLGFKFVPSVNAVSRMGLDTNLVVEAMIEKNLDEAVKAAQWLVDTNEARKALTTETCALVEADVEKELEANPNAPFIIVADNRVTSGIAGIVAGRLKETFARPCAVLTEASPGVLKGSVRGVDGFNLKEALDNVPEGILAGYGGHAKAAGLTVMVENLEPLKESLMTQANNHFAGQAFQEFVELDYILEEEECSISLVETLSMLEPCGEGFSPPLFGLKAGATSFKTMGSEQQHVKYTTARGTTIIEWSGAEKAHNAKTLPSKFIGVPQINMWQNTATIQFLCK